MRDLSEWHGHLAQHFAKLCGARQGGGSDRPIFALEHGLTRADTEALAKAIRLHISHSVPSWDHVLAWIIYGAEIGYRYAGDEYWQTFEEETPGWTLRGNRYWIRDGYRWFQKKYGGAQPSGAWAEHFSIICWPITHAILPRDLQRQLAPILYEIRHSFSAELFESSSKLGEFISARSWDGTSRFRNFAQETNLVGQIAAALLLEEGFGSASLIHPAALQRITEDLERERRARDWLRGARRFAQERAQVRGLGLGRDASPNLVGPFDEARAEVAALGIEPRMVLRPIDPVGSSWKAYLEIPDLSHLLVRFPKTRDILTGCRCSVAGAGGRPLARGRCLHGAQRITLSRWPRTDEVLLQFEQRDAQLEYLLRTECLLRPGPAWLFRIASDGLAYETRSLRVRPGQTYILINTDSPLGLSGYARTIELDCDGVHGARLDLPAALGPDWEEALRRLGLGLAKTIEVWPAGLGAVVWDGEGHGEWLASERPCLAIHTDHSIPALLVSMGAALSLEVTSVPPGEVIFVELPQLPVGLHTVRVCTRTSPTGEMEPLGDLDVVMRIREARPWSSGVSPHGPLIAQVDPPTPTLEQLWEGRVDVSLQGPHGRRIKCLGRLLERDGAAPIVTRQLPSIRLPVTANVWRAHFEKHFRRTRTVEDAYDVARVCELEFTADELGAFTVRCERQFTPLRWAVRRRGERYVVRLLDDTGADVQSRVTRAPFETPCSEEEVGVAPEYDVPSSGGMYVARIHALTAAIILPPIVSGLADLRCSPSVDRGTRSAESILRALSIARLWDGARLTGNFFSAMRQRDVLFALTTHVVGLVCGDNWTRAEAAVRQEKDGLARLQDAISKRHEERAVGEVLAREYTALAGATCEERITRIASLAMKLHLLPSAQPGDDSDPRWLSELALRLASAPADVEDWAGHKFRAGVTRLLEVPTLARAARFLVVAIDLHLESRAALGELYAGWGWR